MFQQVKCDAKESCQAFLRFKPTDHYAILVTDLVMKLSYVSYSLVFYPGCGPGRKPSIMDCGL